MPKWVKKQVFWFSKEVLKRLPFYNFKFDFGIEFEKVKKIFLDLKPKAKANPDDHPLQVKVHNARDIMEELNDQISDLAMQVKNVNRAIGKAAAQEQKAAKDRKA